jgi:hypothetical protein
MISAMEVLESTKAASATFGDEPLLVSPDGKVIDLAHGYIPLLLLLRTRLRKD